MERDDAIEAVVGAWESHVNSLPYDRRPYWWEGASAREIAELAVDALFPEVASR